MSIIIKKPTSLAVLLEADGEHEFGSIGIESSEI